MNSKVKRFLSAFGISFVVSFALYYIMVNSSACLIDWGTECSNDFLIRAGLSTIIFTFLNYSWTKNKNRDTNNEKLKL